MTVSAGMVVAPYDAAHDALPAHRVPDHRSGAKSEVYDALGLEFRRDMDIVPLGREGSQQLLLRRSGTDEELELTFNDDDRTYDLGTAHGHIALAVEDLDQTLERLKEQRIEPEREPYRVREGGSRLCFVQDPGSYFRTLIYALSQTAPDGDSSNAASASSRGAEGGGASA
jgi:lactoylglutathione lyase